MVRERHRHLHCQPLRLSGASGGTLTKRFSDAVGVIFVGITTGQPRPPPVM